MERKYCNSLTEYSRFKTREVTVGDIVIGGNYQIRVQTMTTTDTMNTAATVQQSIRCIEAGSELVRITAPSIDEANNLADIKKELRKRGFKTPIVADIHFTPNAAEIAARIVEKVRINPGNYADKKKFQTIEYTDQQYQIELERIRERFLPLVKICKQHDTAMRIGTNHGSLSDRIMSRYGDTPAGMVESAFEFLTIAEDEGYYNIVLSMKSSNPQVMVHAYRLLVNRMIETGRNYPLHLGVTEAGDGEDGRIKSSIGIGTLLEDGLGDTIRVSLTEDPEFEIPVAKALVQRYDQNRKTPDIPSIDISPVNPFEYLKRKSVSVGNIGGNHVPVVVADFSGPKKITEASLHESGFKKTGDNWIGSDIAADYLFVGKNEIDIVIPAGIGIIKDYSAWNKNPGHSNHFPLLTITEYLTETFKSTELNFVEVTIGNLTNDLIEKLKDDLTSVLVLSTDHPNGMMEQRRSFFELINRHVSNPVIIKRTFNEDSRADLTLHAATDFGALFIEGFGDGIWIHSPTLDNNFINRLSFGILQGTRQRISKTEFISCPSCGRTLFDLQLTTNQIRSRTNHLKGVKIAIMGCIVNGPGEMADADYGYVGSGLGKITLYKGKEIVKRGVETSVAVDELINLIKENGDWVENEQ